MEDEGELVSEEGRRRLRLPLSWSTSFLLKYLPLAPLAKVDGAAILSEILVALVSVPECQVPGCGLGAIRVGFLL